MSKTKVLCTCSRCRLRVCRHQGVETNGQNVTSNTRNKHILRDDWEKAWNEEEVEKTLSSTILLTSSATTISRKGSKVLPVRRTDSHADVDGAGVHNDDGEGRGEVEVTPSVVSSALSSGMGNISHRAKVLSDLNSLVDRTLKTVPQQLTFSAHPRSLSEAAPEPRESMFTGVYSWLLRQRGYIEDRLAPIGHHDSDQRRLALLRHVNKEIARMERMRDKAWSKRVAEEVIRAHLAQDGGSGPFVVKDTQAKDKARVKSFEPFVLAALIMTSVLHAIAAASRIYGQYILATLEVILFGMFTWCNVRGGRSPVLTPEQFKMMEELPSDVKTALSWLGLTPDFIRYACCPVCLATYAPDPGRPDDPYPHSCTFQETDKPMCGASLVHKQDHVPPHKGGKVRVTYEPLLTFPYRSVQSWMLDVLHRSGLPKTMKRAWDDPPNGRWRDIFHAPALRNFLGPDRKTPFSQQSDGQLHLVFSLFVDWFNPFGNKKAGKSHSIGAIYMVCLNLPNNLRYRSENIYLVGIIPGPKEPDVTQLNHFLRPLIDEMLVLWHRGYLFTIDNAPLLVRAAIIPLVCDLPALRKAAGFAGHGAKHFCSFCELLKDRINDLNRLEWTRLSWEEHLHHAMEWRDAATESERDNLFKKYGIRWSELLRLEYWDPTQFAVVDAMHNLFLGELRHHCREVWGIDVKDKSSDSSKTKAHTPEEQQVHLQRVITGLRKGSKTALNKERKGYVVAVAEVNGVSPEGGALTKDAYIKALLTWVGRGAVAINCPPVLQEATTDFHVAAGPHDISKFRVLDQATIDEVRRDITATYLPSWMERPPRNFGSPSHGKLKADQWRTVCTVSLVITLGRLWGAPDALERHRLLLDNFLALVCAVDLATRRSTDMERIKKFDGYMMKYLTSLRNLFGAQLVPNHHLSLHLWECLSLFGPVHSWWAYPFERFNGLLQRLNTNNKTKDIAITFMRYFYIGATLRWLMNMTSWPTEGPFQRMVAAFNEAVMNKKTASGVRVADFVPFGDDESTVPHYDEKQEATLPRATYDQLYRLLSPSGAFDSMYGPHNGAPILHNGVNYIGRTLRSDMTFATRKAGLRNSFVLFVDPSRPADDGLPRAGQISEIFLHGRTQNGQTIVEPFCLVDEYQALHDEDLGRDPYRRFPDIETRLFYDTVASTSMVRFSDIHSHFAALFCQPEGFARRCVVARSLSRD